MDFTKIKVCVALIRGNILQLDLVKLFCLQKRLGHSSLGQPLSGSQDASPRSYLVD
jgi:hypothetical protein